jgi:hypothetical protein
MSLRLFACIILLSAVAAIAQDTSKSIALTDRSNVPTEDIAKAFRKGCPSISISSDKTKSDFKLDATRKSVIYERAGASMPSYGVHYIYDLTLIDRNGKFFPTSSTESLANAAMNICQDVFVATGGQTGLAPSKHSNKVVIVEVIATQDLTQSIDARGDMSGGIVGGIVAATTGRRTHTDSSTLHVIVNGEHALLDCYERRKGCTTIGPGTYYGEYGEKDSDSIWVSYDMPLSHKPVRNHYRIAGSW